MTKSTSKEAFNHNEESGLNDTLRNMVLLVVQKHGPISQGECAAEHFPYTKRECVGPRFAELEKRGLLTVVDKRPCRTSGKKVEVWAATMANETPLQKKEKPSVIIARLEAANTLMRNLLLELFNESLDNRILITLGEINDPKT